MENNGYNIQNNQNISNPMDIYRNSDDYSSYNYDNNTFDSAQYEYMQMKKNAFVKSRRSNFRLIIISILALVTLAAIVFGIYYGVSSYINSPQTAINKEAKSKYAIALEYIDSGDYETALNELNEINSQWSDYDKVTNEKIDVVTKIVEQKAEKYKETKDYATLLTLISKNVSDINKSNKLKTIFNEIVPLYREQIFELVSSLCQDNEYDAAYEKLAVAYRITNFDSTLKEKMISVKKEAIKQYVTKCEKNKEYKNALEYIFENLSVVENDPEIVIKQQSLQEKYVNDTIEKAKKAYKSSGYNAALSEIKEALKFLPENSKLISEYDKYALCEPVDLDLDSFYTRTGEMYVKVDVEDSFSNIRTNALFGKNSALYGENSRTYDIGGKYDILTATVFIAKNYRSKDYVGTIKIFGDGKLLYQNCNITSQFKPTNITVDISGVKDLKIEMYRAMVLMSDIKLSKAVS